MISNKEFMEMAAEYNLYLTYKELSAAVNALNATNLPKAKKYQLLEKLLDELLITFIQSQIEINGESKA